MTSAPSKDDNAPVLASDPQQIVAGLSPAHCGNQHPGDWEDGCWRDTTGAALGTPEGNRGVL